MKKKSTLLKIAIITLVGFMVTNVKAQSTAGTLEFSVKPSAPSGTWGLKHDVAIWITNSSGTFVKTKAEYGGDTDHLTAWKASTSTLNTVDATTGATISDYTASINIIWNGTDVNGTIVPDGVYTIWVEFGWGKDKVAAHAVSSYTFDKGAVISNPTLTETTNFLSPTLIWTPTSTGINENTNSTVSVFPSPASDVLNINLGSKIEDTRVDIFNVTGEVVFSSNYSQASGEVKVDLKDISNGVYFVNVRRNDVETKTKILVVK